MKISKCKVLFYLNFCVQLTLTLTLNNNNNSNSNNDYENISDLNNNDDANNGLVQQSDQINLLSKQMNALMIRRRDDMKLLENNLKKYIKKNFLQYPDMNIQNEINELRDELKSIHATKLTSNKERLTIEWLKESINELRGELIVLQEQSNNITREIQKNNQYLNNLNELKTNIDNIKLDYDKINKNYNNLDTNLNELRDETEFNMNSNNHIYVQNDEQQQHKKRHLRYLRHQIVNLEKSSENLKNQLAEIKTNNYDDRIHEVEMKQNHLMNVNFNLTREIVNFDKLHSSMLELLEDVEAVQTKVDNTIPEIQKEISKLEFNTAQLTSDQNNIREETQVMNKKLDQTLQATSTVQDDKLVLRAQQEQISQLRYDIDKIKSIANINRENLQKRIEKIEKDSKQNATTKSSSVSILLTDSKDIKSATDIVKDLENIEQQYESIINKLPNDCSQINFDLKQNNQGLYLIAPLGQHNPILTQCNNKWTTIQKRYDGNVDFNQSWEQYANGFGNPSGEFWIGNNVLHQLTQKNCTKLKISMQDIYDNQWAAEYDEFYVAPRDEGYRLVVSKYSGNASDALDYQNHMEFSAIDMDRDISNTHCAANYEGGWWFSHCQHANLNGRYNLGLTWFDSTRNEWIAVKSSHMMISQRSNCKPK